MAMVNQTMQLGSLEKDWERMSPMELERLRNLLPKDCPTQGLSQLDIILEAIHYIKNLQYQLQSGQ